MVAVSSYICQILFLRFFFFCPRKQSHLGNYINAMFSVLTDQKNKYNRD